MDLAQRPIAVALALAVAILVMLEFESSEIQDYGVFLALAIGVVTWWLAEMVFGATIAVFETEHHRIIRTRDIPQAKLVRK